MKLYCFWTGDNELTPNRKRCLEYMKWYSRLDLILVTPANLHNFLVEPLHEAYQYLSLNHKSDYLRCYFMHFYGGAYCDIKEIRHSWKECANILEYSDNTWIIGYNERPEWRSVDVISPYIENKGLVDELNKSYCNNLIGNGAFLMKKQTPFTKEWYSSLLKLMDSKLEQLKQNPADVTSYEGITNKNLNYPLGWAEVQAAIFMPLIYKYREHVLNILPEPIFYEYR